MKKHLKYYYSPRPPLARQIVTFAPPPMKILNETLTVNLAWEQPKITINYQLTKKASLKLYSLILSIHITCQQEVKGWS